jgi:hypothetical protein
MGLAGMGNSGPGSGLARQCALSREVRARADARPGGAHGGGRRGRGGAASAGVLSALFRERGARWAWRCSRSP